VRLGIQSQLRFLAVAVDKEGDPVPLTNLAWSVSNTNLATISPEGVLSTGVSPGSLSVTAILTTPQGFLTDSAQVEIVP
jgi:hypothetical protein